MMNQIIIIVITQDNIVTRIHSTPVCSRYADYISRFKQPYHTNNYGACKTNYDGYLTRIRTSLHGRYHRSIIHMYRAELCPEGRTVKVCETPSEKTILMI